MASRAQLWQILLPSEEPKHLYINNIKRHQKVINSPKRCKPVYIYSLLTCDYVSWCRIIDVNFNGGLLIEEMCSASKIGNALDAVLCIAVDVFI